MSFAARCSLVFFLLGSVLAGCGRDGRVDEGPPGAALVAIDPESLELYLAQEFRFDVVEQRGAARTSILNDPKLELSVANTQIVTMPAPGQGRAVGPGSTEIVAALGLRGARAPVTVRAARLVGIEVEPIRLTLKVGEQAPLKVTGRLDDDSTLDLTEGWTGTTYQAGDASIASVDADGNIQAVKVGETVVVVAHPPNLRVEVRIEVDDTAAEFVELILTPEVLDLRPRDTGRLTALGRRGDGTTVDLVASGLPVAFASENTAIASVDAGGSVRAGGTNGSTRVIARLGDLSDASQIRVGSVDNPLVSLEVNSLQLRRRDRGQLRVTGRFRDGSSRDLTQGSSGTTYQSNNPGVARPNGDGLVQSFDQDGFAEITVRNSGLTASARVVVSEQGSVIDLFVQPDGATIPIGGIIQLQVIAVFSDGRTEDVTFRGETQYVSFDRVTAIIGPGLIEGRIQGVSQISVSFGGIERVVTVFVQSSPIALRIEPSSFDLFPGEIANFIVIATFNDGSEADVTFDPNLFLSVRDTFIANLFGPGTLGANAPGRTQLSASYFGVFNVADVFVRGGPTLVAIQLLGPGQLTIGDSQQVTVLGIFDDGSFQDLTFSPGTRIFVSDPVVLELQGNTVIGRREGVSTVTAESGGFRSSIQVRVVSVNDPVVGLRWVPGSMQLAPGGTATARLIATHASGRESDVTFDNRVTGSAMGPIDIRPDPNGIAVTALAPGMAQIDASYLGFFASLPITITNSTIVALEILVQGRIDVGVSGPLQVIAHLNDGSIVDVTFDPSLRLSVSPSAVLGASPGQINGLSVGRATITAMLGNVSDTAVVQVVESPIIALFWRPQSINMIAGNTTRASLMAQRQNGSIEDISNNPNVVLTVVGPVQVTPQSGGFVIQAQSQGMATIDAVFSGFSAQLRVTIQPAMPVLVSIRIEPNPVVLNVNATRTVQVIGTFSDGTTAPVTTGIMFNSLNGMIATISSSGVVTGVTPGNTQITATVGNLFASAQVTINQTAPTITSIMPNAIAVGSPSIVVDVRGTNFAGGMTATINGEIVPFFFLNTTRIRVAIPARFFTAPGTLTLIVTSAGGAASNPGTIDVGFAPSIAALSPDEIIAGTTTQIVASGSGLNNLTISSPGLTFGPATSSSGGAIARFTVTATNATPIGPHTVTFSNRFGSDTAVITVLSGAQPGLVVGPGQTRILSGSQTFTFITVEIGGRIVGSGLEPLSLTATGPINIRGLIDVSGRAGDQGSQIAADGGEAGPGGAGGGAAGDGDTMTTPAGGAGSPPGDDGVTGMGAGTPAANGGGEGGGRGAAGGCARAGGGGGLDSAGGNGGGNNGPGSGGQGGMPGAGSLYRAGTGGGGGSTCGANSGGGGGGGGGALILQSLGGPIRIDGQILSNGGDGGEGFLGTAGGGGGSGGRIDIITQGGQINIPGSITARGGNGGRSDLGATGGGGAGGRVTVNATPGGTVIGAAMISVAGGQPGPSLGGGTPGLPGGPGTAVVTP